MNGNEKFIICFFLGFLFWLRKLISSNFSRCSRSISTRLSLERFRRCYSRELLAVGFSTFQHSVLLLPTHNTTTAPKQMSRTVREICECVFNDRGTTWKMITISMENPTNQYQEPECLAWAAKVQKAIFHPHMQPSQAPCIESFTGDSTQRFPFLFRSVAVTQMKIHQLIVINQWTWRVMTFTLLRFYRRTFY